MKLFLYCILFFVLLSYQETNAQVYFKTEYITSSSYRGEKEDNLHAKGNLKVIQGGFRVPLSLKMDENKRPTVWAIGCSGAHATMDNKKLPKELCPSKMLNLQFGLIHSRPLNAKWSMLATVGVGLYMDNDNLSKASWNNVLGQGGVIFIRHLRPNLDLGAGVALSNTFGFPMILPAFYLTWNLEGRYDVKVSFVDAVRVSAGMHLNKYLKLSLIAEMNGILALTEKDGKDMYFTQQYVIVGLQPEITISKSLSLAATAGITPVRSAFYSKRSLKELFSDDDESDPYFKIGFYCSLGLTWKF